MVKILLPEIPKSLEVGESPEEKHVKIVNNLVAAAFGRKYRGDARIITVESEELDGCFEIYIRTRTHIENCGDRLEGIAAPRFFELVYSDAGRFTSQDGSQLAVKPAFRKKAERYAALYEQKFGGEVVLRLDELASAPRGYQYKRLRPLKV